MIYFISYNLFFRDKIEKRKMLAWLVVDLWLELNLGSRLARATLQLLVKDKSKRAINTRAWESCVRWRNY